MAIKEEDKFKTIFSVPARHYEWSVAASLHTPGSRGRNLQATRCVLGGKSRVKAVTLFLTPQFMKTPNKAKVGRPYKLLRLIT